MEVLNKIWEHQCALEDALRMESTPEDVSETKEGRQLLKYLRWRRRVIGRCYKIFKRIY